METTNQTMDELLTAVHLEAAYQWWLERSGKAMYRRAWLKFARKQVAGMRARGELA